MNDKESMKELQDLDQFLCNANGIENMKERKPGIIGECELSGKD
jgi:hypothetical protein